MASRGHAADRGETDGATAGRSSPNPSRVPDRAVVLSAPLHSARTMSPAAGELSKLLDGDDAANGGADAADAERCERAEMARAQAESDAAEGKRRLEVARQQFAEYATSKADESKAVRDVIRELAAGGAPEFQQALERLDSLIAQAETEARAVAATAEAERASANGAANGDARRGPDASETMEVDVSRSGPGVSNELDLDLGLQTKDVLSVTDDDSALNFAERAKYIPLRLDMEERKLLRLLEAALHVSEYTDHVDVVTFSGKTQRITKQLREICAIMCGLVVATDYRRGQDLIKDKDFETRTRVSSKPRRNRPAAQSDEPGEDARRIREDDVPCRIR